MYGGPLDPKKKTAWWAIFVFILYSFAEFVYYFILGLGAEVVAGFADAHKSAIASGFPDTIDTYGLVSGR